MRVTAASAGVSLERPVARDSGGDNKAAYSAPTGGLSIENQYGVRNGPISAQVVFVS